MGTSFSQRQSELLTSHFARVTLMLDGDQPGQQAAEIIAQLLKPKMPVDKLALPKDVQPDQLSSAEINLLLVRTTDYSLTESPSASVGIPIFAYTNRYPIPPRAEASPRPVIPHRKQSEKLAGKQCDNIGRKD